MKFSFIVPMYDSATYLAKTLDSIVAMVGQKKEAAEVLLLDDGSTDDTVEIARKYATDHTFFKVFANPHQGVSATRNFGISKAYCPGSPVKENREQRGQYGMILSYLICRTDFICTIIL